MTQIIAIHSFRGGTGKSNVTANCAAILAASGANVAVVDTDIQSPGIHVLFGLDPNDLTYTLNDYLWGRCSIQETAEDVTGSLNGNMGNGRLYLIPSSYKINEITRILQEGYEVKLLNRGFRTLIKELQLDYLLIDTHPGLNEETLLSIAICDSLLLLLRPDRQDYQGASVTLEVARKLEVPNLYLAVNKATSGYDFETLKQQVQTVYDCPVLAVLPLSEEIAQLASSELFCMRYPKHEITDALKNIALSFREKDHEMLAM
jgi:MinD-like ATPase involved in chromosome partitioning or flagellar assembly